MIKKIIKVALLSSSIFLLYGCGKIKTPARSVFSLNSGWKTVSSENLTTDSLNFNSLNFNDSAWLSVDVPHNWDRYEGYLRKLHGNRHGYSWYRKSFSVKKSDAAKRYFLFFEGVGSYATVWVNGQKVGVHAGGRTTFTIDITEVIQFVKPNILAVRADHPANIRNLPWVCGGCSNESGFSEGSQPMGIFRPVSLIVTNDIRIEPFGIHLWNDTTISDKSAILFNSVEIKNYSAENRTITVVSSIFNTKGKKIDSQTADFELSIGKTEVFRMPSFQLKNPKLWSPEEPYLYTVRTEIIEKDKLVDSDEIKYGIRWISWPVYRNDSSGTFNINGKPVFLNGIGEYEHMLGNSHAFTDEQIKARVGQIKACGFNAFRDAHQPHNLRYQDYWDSLGMLWWTQFSAHIWYDTPEFRENFKTLLREWVRERRNNPSNIVWGLQNESTLPEDFARECVEIIREMDPTTSSQRIVTTCNGGVGTDWNVIQNWSGTYGGNPENYATELSEQLLNGEYGAWRSIDLHNEGPFQQNGILSENRMTQLLEMKVRKADSVKDKVCGQFLWLLSSHDNPGRIQNGEGLRDIDRIGPVNYKGLLTPWGEPTNAYYMYRANYAPKETSPMVYIVSHTWPNRWTEPGIKYSIVVYSNCDEVELFNDIEGQSLGRLKNRSRGLSFVWDTVLIKYNLLYAKGIVNGKEVASDMVRLLFLPEAPGLETIKKSKSAITTGKEGYNYLYRINCGGPDFTDENGNLWMADKNQTSDTCWGSKSWTAKFEGIPSFFGSQRRTFDPIMGTSDWNLFQTFRYGLNELSFNFPVPNGEYLVELYFTEPWYGTGGGMNCEGWRIFDVAINDEIVLKDLDIWKEAGHDKALKKECVVQVSGGVLSLHFPKVKSGQAIISAIAIASKNSTLTPAPASTGTISEFITYGREKLCEYATGLDWGDKLYTDNQVKIKDIPSQLFGAEWIRTPLKIDKQSDTIASFVTSEACNVFVAVNELNSNVSGWLTSFSETPLILVTDNNQPLKLYILSVPKNQKVVIHNTGNPVFVVPQSSLSDPADQRPLKIYSAYEAVLKSSNLIRRTEGERQYLEITDNSSVLLEWNFYIGLASRYNVNIKYQNNSGKPINAEIIVATKNGILISKQTISFDNRPGQWRTLKSTTGTMINAGDYRIRLKVNAAKGLLIQHLEIQ